MYTVNKDYVKKKYNLKLLREIENLVGDCVDIQGMLSNLTLIIYFFLTPFCCSY